MGMMGVVGTGVSSGRSRGDRHLAHVAGEGGATGYWLLATGDWRLATGYWLLATGYWLLATGYWLLATGYWLLLTFPTTVKDVAETAARHRKAK